MTTEQTALVERPKTDIESHIKGNPSVGYIVVIILGVALQSWALVGIPIVWFFVARSGLTTAVTGSKLYQSAGGHVYHFVFDYVGIPDFWRDEDNELDEVDELPAPALTPARAERPSTPAAVTVANDAPNEKRELIKLLRHQHFMLVHGAHSAGKTTLLCHLMSRSPNVVGINPHHEPNTWPIPEDRIYGKRYNYDEISAVLTKMEALRVKRHIMVSDGFPKDQFPPILIVIDEALSVFHKCPELSQIFQSFITEAAKIRMGMILGSHTSMVEPLGLKNRGDLKRNLAQIDIELDLEGKRSATLTVGRFKEEVQLPGRFHTISRAGAAYLGENQVPKVPRGVPKVPQPVSVPESSQVPKVLLPVGDRKGLIKSLLLQGWKPNDIAALVKGRRADVFAEIKALRQEAGV